MPRIVPVLLLVGSLAAANRFTPGLVQAVLVLTGLYLVVTHSAAAGGVLSNASAALAHAFTTSSPKGDTAPAGVPVGGR